MLIILKKSHVYLSLVLIVSILFSLSYLSIAKERDKDFAVLDKGTIIIDAGHGGMDGGAVGVGGTLEKDINLKISLKLKELAEKNGLKVIMTRDKDVSLHTTDSNKIRTQKRSDLDNRKKVLNENPNYIFVSIHQNQFEQSKYKGAQVFYADNDSSCNLGTIIQKSLIDNLQDGNTRVAKKITNDVYLLKGVQSTAVVVECGFLSNEEEEKLLNTDEYQTKVADAILKGILQFK